MTTPDTPAPPAGPNRQTIENRLTITAEMFGRHPNFREIGELIHEHLADALTTRLERDALARDLAAARAALALLADARSLAVVEAAFAEALRGQDILEAAHDLTGKRMMAAERERDDLRETLRFYAERENYTSGTHTFPDGSTVALYSPIENDSGAKARAALARLGAGVDETERGQGEGKE